MKKKFLILPAVLALCAIALSQHDSSIVQGAFTASAGRGMYRGKWTARISPRIPNAAAGSWILLNERNDVVLQGTWSARKSGTAWRGTWNARALHGGAYAGAWTASEPGPASKTFAEMLQAAVKSGAAGTWRSRGYGGDWRLTPTL